MKEKIIIAIDGPAGSGKSTVAKIIAQKLGIMYLDTGAIYRAVGLAALENNVDPDNENEVVNLINRIKIDIIPESGRQKILLNGVDITERIRTEEIGMAASKVSKHEKVRKALLKLQRDFAKRFSLVAEGRDTTTVVFPEAKVKIFLDASDEVRAQRRFKELKEKGADVTFEEILKSIKLRDKQDSTRKFAPLKKAEDAILIDTSDMSIDEVVDIIIEIAREKYGSKLQ